MMVPTYKNICILNGMDLMLCLLLGPLGFNCLIYFAPVFSCMYSLVLIFDLSPFNILIYMYRVYLLDFICSSIQFYVLLSPYLCFISILYHGLYVLEKLVVFHANQKSMCLDPHLN